MLFAEVTPSGVENFLAIVFYLAGGIAAVVGLYKMLGKPAPTETALANQPITIKADKEFASKSEHDGLRGEFKDFRDEVRVSFDEASQTSRQSREKIYVEQRRQAELLAHNTAKTDLTHQQIATMDGKIDRIRDLLAKLDRK